MIKLSDIVLEIGEGGSVPYEFSFKNKEGFRTNKNTIYNYTFDLEDEPDYEGSVSIIHKVDDRFEQSLSDSLTISFNVKSKYYWNQPEVDYDTTDLGLKVMFRIISTVFKVIDDVVKRVDSPIEKVVFSSVDSKGGEFNQKGEVQRAKLYDRFIRKNFNVKDEKKIDGDYIYFLKEPL